MRPYLAIAILGLVAASAVQAAAVYKWKDDKGVVHYTDAPPEGRDFERMKSAAPDPAAAAVPADDAAPEAGAEADPAAAPEPRQGSPEANCASARRNIEAMERFEVISMDRDGDGEPEKLTAEQKEEELQRARSLAGIFCPPEAPPQQ